MSIKYERTDGTDRKEVLCIKPVKAFLTMLVVLAMVVAMLPMTGVMVMANTPEPGTFAQLQALIDSVDDTKLITLDKNYVWTSTDEAEGNINIDTELTLDLNGWAIQGGGVIGAIKVNNGGSLTIIDNGPDVPHYGNVDEYGVWKWTGDGTGTTEIKGGIITGFFDGVSTRGQLDIEGGNIAGNEVGISVINNSESVMNGGRICYSRRQGVSIAYAKFTLNEGRIDHNNGGAVLEYDGTYLMNGGVITENKSSSNSAGIEGDGGIITITNGSITNNTGGKASVIYAAFSTPELNLTAAEGKKIEITGNQAKASGIEYGAVYAFTPFFNVSGYVVIDGNTDSEGKAANLAAFGIPIKTAAISEESVIGFSFIDFSQTAARVPKAGVLTLGYAANNPDADVDSIFRYEDSDDFYTVLNASGEIEVKGLTAGETLCDIEYNATPGAGGVITQKSALKAKAGDVISFKVVPNEGYDTKAVTVDGNEVTPSEGKYTYTIPDGAEGTIEVVAEFTHTHAWEYSANDNILTVTCTNNCPDGKAVSLELLAEDAEHDGSTHGARFDADSLAAWKAEGFAEPTISYETSDGIGVDGVPSEIGDYAAYATVLDADGNEVTASVTYSITEPASPEKKDYDGEKTASAIIKAEKGATVSVKLPGIPEGAAYGTPVKTNPADNYSVSAVKADGTVTVTSEGVPEDAVSMTFKVPVTESTEYKNYDIMVTLNVTHEPVGDFVTVTFDTNGGTPVPDPQTVKMRTACKKPGEDPTKDGFVFAGWYADATLTNLYDFDMPIDRDITIYAKWQKLYNMKEGKDQVINVALGKDAVFSSEAPFSEFKYIRVDGEKVAKSNYSAKSGSTVITLKASYLKDLEVGTHTLRIVSDGGFAECKFTIENKAVKSDTNAGNTNAGNTNTGDANSTLPWALLMSVAAVALCAMLRRKRS